MLTSSRLQARTRNRKRKSKNEKKRKAISENCLCRFISRSGKTEGQDAITFVSSAVVERGRHGTCQIHEGYNMTGKEKGDGQGVWEMRSSISGTAAEGIVKIDS